MRLKNYGKTGDAGVRDFLGKEECDGHRLRGDKFLNTEQIRVGSPKHTCAKFGIFTLVTIHVVTRVFEQRPQIGMFFFFLRAEKLLFFFVFMFHRNIAIRMIFSRTLGRTCTAPQWRSTVTQ